MRGHVLIVVSFACFQLFYHNTPPSRTTNNLSPTPRHAGDLVA